MSREKWSSTTAFILVSIGSAVGIGNVWRFPYVMGVNGGGAFLLPYFIAVFIVGLSIMMLEFAIGRHFNKSVVEAFSAVSSRLRPVGFLFVLVVALILSYYWVIMGWVLAYFSFYVAGTPLPFATFTSSYLPIPFYAIAAILTLVVVSLGVRRGLEGLSKLLIPILLVIMVLLSIYALALPGSAQGLAFLYQPDLSKLGDAMVWTAAFGQAFFSLGVGTGIMLTYGSYAGKGSIARSSATIAVSDVSISLLAGLMIFPLVFSFGLDPATGVQLAFITLPSAFGQMGFGQLLGAVFFLLLFFAAFTSAVSMIEVPVATLMDAYKIERKRASLISAAAIFALGIPAALSYTPLSLSLSGIPLLDVYDTAFGTLSIIVTGLVLSLIGGWCLDKTILRDQLGGGRVAQSALRFALRYAIPLILAASLVARLVLLL